MKSEIKELVGALVTALLVMAAIIAVALLCNGCIADKASHQNGIVLYVSTSGQLGVGYGETEDLPGGCTYRREVTNVSPCFWADGTNYTHTVTEWDTRGMVTNAAANAVESEVSP